MTTGATLMSLKQEAYAAHTAAENRENRGVGWFLLIWLAALISLAGGITAVLVSAATIGGRESNLALHDVGLGWAVAGGGVGLIALGYFMFRLPSIITSRDKVLTKLRDAEQGAYDTYSNALKAELATYGVDTTTMNERTDFKKSDYDFTALRNGDPIDVNVREFENEIIFMLNGERMQKPVTV